MVNRINFEDDLAHDFSQFAPSLVSKYRHNLKDAKNVDKEVSLEEIPRSMIYKMFEKKSLRDKSLSHIRGNRITSCVPELKFYENLEPPNLPFKCKHDDETYKLKDNTVTKRNATKILAGVVEHFHQGECTASSVKPKPDIQPRSVSMFEPLDNKKQNQLGLIKKLKRNSKTFTENSSSHPSRRSLSSEIFKLPTKHKSTSTNQTPVPKSLKNIPAPYLLAKQEKFLSISHSRSTSTVPSSLHSNNPKTLSEKKSTKPLPQPPVIKEDSLSMKSTDSLDELFDLYYSTTNSSTEVSIEQSPTLKTRSFHAKVESGCSAPSTEPALTYCSSSAIDSQFSFEEEDDHSNTVTSISGKNLPPLPVKTFSQSEVRDYDNSFKPKVLGVGIPPPLPQHFRRSVEIETRTDLERKPSQVKQERSDTKIFTRKPRTLKKELDGITELPEHSPTISSIVPFILPGYEERSSLRVVNRTTPTPSRDITPKAG